MNKTYYEIDESTGELLPTKDRLVVLEAGDCVKRKNQIETAKIIYTAKNENGRFVWLLFRYGEELFPNLSAANLTRLIYAATFCDQDGVLMSKEDLKKHMKLNRARWSEFWAEVTENNILYENNKIVYVNKNIFCQGSIVTDDNYIRLFCECVQTLYEQCESANMHKQLAYVFKIIPFINRRTNTASFNQTEQNEQLVKTMRLGDFCDAIGYERKNARRLAKDLLKIRVNGELVIGFFVSDMEEDKWVIVSNPILYFGGKYDAVYKKCRNLFLQEALEYKLALTQQND